MTRTLATSARGTRAPHHRLQPAGQHHLALHRGEVPDAATEPLQGPSVVLADVDDEIRRSTRRVLSQHGFRVVDECLDAASLARVGRTQRPDLCLVDIRLPGGACRAIAQLRAATPKTVSVVFSATVCPDDLLAALRAGASGYLFTSTDPARLPLALHSVLGGEPAIPRELVGCVIDAYRRSNGAPPVEPPGFDTLSRRERDVLELLRHGLETPDIARSLFISTGTVRTHIASIVHKLGARDRDEALAILGVHTSTRRCAHEISVDLASSSA